MPIPHELKAMSEKDKAIETKSRQFINYRYQSKLQASHYYATYFYARTCVTYNPSIKSFFDITAKTGEDEKVSPRNHYSKRDMSASHSL